MSLGISEMLPAVAVLPFMLYQLAGFGTLSYVVSKPVNWAINIGILVLIVASYAANRLNNFGAEKVFVAVLVLMMAAVVFHGVMKLKRMQEDFTNRCPAPPPKEKKAKKEKHHDEE